MNNHIVAITRLFLSLDVIFLTRHQIYSFSRIKYQNHIHHTNHIMNMNDYAYATENYEIGLIAGLMLQKK